MIFAALFNAVPFIVVSVRVTVDRSDSMDVSAGYTQSFLQNPYYFMFASLAKPDDDTELHWLKVGLPPIATILLTQTSYE
jgi:hypothetical protein